MNKLIEHFVNTLNSLKKINDLSENKLFSSIINSIPTRVENKIKLTNLQHLG